MKIFCKVALITFFLVVFGFMIGRGAYRIFSIWSVASVQQEDRRMIRLGVGDKKGQYSYGGMSNDSVFVLNRIRIYPGTNFYPVGREFIAMGRTSYRVILVSPDSLILRKE